MVKAKIMTLLMWFSLYIEEILKKILKSREVQET